MRDVAPHRFLADLNISPATVADLQLEGWNIVRASELLPATASDEELLALARQEGRVIVTHDLDFSALLALSGLSQPSLITLRLASGDPIEVAGRLKAVRIMLDEVLRQPCAVTIEDRKQGPRVANSLVGASCRSGLPDLEVLAAAAKARGVQPPPVVSPAGLKSFFSLQGPVPCTPAAAPNYRGGPRSAIQSLPPAGRRVEASFADPAGPRPRTARPSTKAPS